MVIVWHPWPPTLACSHLRVCVFTAHGEQSQLLRLLNHRADKYQPTKRRSSAKPRRPSATSVGSTSSRASQRSDATGHGHSATPQGGVSSSNPLFAGSTANPLMALSRANRGKASARSAASSGSKPVPEGQTSTNPLLAMLARSGGSDGPAPSPKAATGSDSPRKRRTLAGANQFGSSRGGASPKSRLRTDSMRQLRIREIDSSADMDMEQGMFQAKVRGGTVKSLVRHLAYTVSMLALDDEGLLDRSDPGGYCLPC